MGIVTAFLAVLDKLSHLAVAQLLKSIGTYVCTFWVARSYPREEKVSQPLSDLRMRKAQAITAKNRRTVWKGLLSNPPTPLVSKGEPERRCFEIPTDAEQY